MSELQKFEEEYNKYGYTHDLLYICFLRHPSHPIFAPYKERIWESIANMELTRAYHAKQELIFKKFEYPELLEAEFGYLLLSYDPYWQYSDDASVARRHSRIEQVIQYYRNAGHTLELKDAKPIPTDFSIYRMYTDNEQNQLTELPLNVEEAKICLYYIYANGTKPEWRNAMQIAREIEKINKVADNWKSRMHLRMIYTPGVSNKTPVLAVTEEMRKSFDYIRDNVNLLPQRYLSNNCGFGIRIERLTVESLNLYGKTILSWNRNYGSRWGMVM